MQRKPASLARRGLASLVSLAVLAGTLRVAHAVPPPLPPTEYWPVTDGAFDLRYFDAPEKAAAQACLAGLDPGKPAYYDAIRSCMQSVWAGYGEPCQTPSADTCDHVDYHQSWCGRREFAAHGASTTWTCRAALTGLPATMEARADFDRATVAVPEQVSGAAGTSTHAGGERVVAVRGEPASASVRNLDSGGTSTSDRYVESYRSTAPPPPAPPSIGGPVLTLPPGSTLPLPPGGIHLPAPAPRAPMSPILSAEEQTKRSRWAANGPAITSCEEYAYEKFLDFSQVEDHARPLRRDPRQTFDSLYAGWSGHAAVATSAGGWVLHDIIGRALPLPSPTIARRETAEGFLRPTSGPTASGMTPPQAIAYLRRWGLAQANTMAFFDFLVRDVYPGVLPLEWFAPQWLDQQHVLDLAWHRQKSLDLAADGYLDEELERAADLQREAWALGVRYAEIAAREAAATPDERTHLYEQRTAIWADLRAAIERGRNLGCLSGAPRTACTWSPSMFTDAFFVYYDKARADAQSACIQRFGEGLLDEADLHARFFFDARPVFARDATKLAQARALYDTYAAKRYLARPDTFEQLSTDSRAYAAAVWHLLGLPDTNLEDAFRGSTEFRHELGKPGLFGMRFGVDGASGLVMPTGLPAPAPLPPGAGGGMDPVVPMDACRIGPFIEGEAHGWVDLFGAEIDLMGLAENATRRHEDGEPAEHDGPEPFGLEVGVTAKGQAFADSPCETADGHPATCTGSELEASVEVAYGGEFAKASATFQAGPVTVMLKAGVSGSFGGTLEFGASDVWVHPSGTTPSTDPHTACHDFHRAHVEYGFGPEAGIYGFVSAGVGLGPIQVGIKGQLTLISLSLPTTYEETYDSSTGVRETGWTTDLVLELLSGKISIYLALDFVVVTVTILELVLFEWKGPTFRFRLQGDSDYQDICWIGEVRALALHTPQVNGCSCSADWCRL